MAYRAIRKNRVLTISEEKAGEYAGMGYTVTDLTGNVVAEPTENTLEGANQQIIRLRKEIETKNIEIIALRTELETLRGNSTRQEENTDSGEENAVATETKASGRRKKN